MSEFKGSGVAMNSSKVQKKTSEGTDNAGATKNYDCDDSEKMVKGQEEDEGEYNVGHVLTCPNCDHKFSAPGAGSEEEGEADEEAQESDSAEEAEQRARSKVKEKLKAIDKRDGRQIEY